MRSRIGIFQRSRGGMTRRQLYRESRRSLQRAIAGRWSGTRAALKRALHDFLKPRRRKLGFLLRLARQSGFAALVAAAILAGGADRACGDETINWVNGVMFRTTDVDARLGGGVIGVGDVNGDGIDDVVSWAARSDLYTMAGATAYVVHGTVAPNTTIEASDIESNSGGFTIEGIQSVGRGRRVGCAGDVNGDGFNDVIVGACAASPNASSCGQAYVVFGGASITGPVECTDIAAETGGGFAINGENAGDYAGHCVAGLGDINGDGYHDVAVGAPYCDGDSIDEGNVYVVFGKSGFTAVELSDVAAGTGGYVIHGGPYTFGKFGWSISCLQNDSLPGECNGDGIPDFVAGASEAGGTGKCYAIFGKDSDTTAQECSDIEAGTGGYVCNGESLSELFGTSVSACNADGDAACDWVCGALGTTGDAVFSGAAFVIPDRAVTTPMELSDVKVGTGGKFLKGENSSDFAGLDVGAADLNGDGKDEILVGAPNGADFNSSYSYGYIYLVDNPANNTPVSLSDVAADSGGFSFSGEAAYNNLGFSVSRAGDMNLDGLEDVIVGAQGFDSNKGRAYVLFSTQTPAASASVSSTTRIGDGAGGAQVPEADYGPVIRAKIDFSDDDSADNGSGGASTETVEIIRSKSGVTGVPNIGDVANVVWHVTTDRQNWSGAVLTLSYLDSEIAGISGAESDLSIFTSDTIDGEFSICPTTVDTVVNQTFCPLTDFSFFIIGNSSTVPVKLSDFTIE